MTLEGWAPACPGSHWQSWVRSEGRLDVLAFTRTEAAWERLV